MVELQIINKILATKDAALLENNGLDASYFVQYTPEINFINEHLKSNGNVPDVETFLSRFPDFDIIIVTETDSYLVDTIREEHLYASFVPVITKVADMIQTDSRQAVEYLKSQLPRLQVSDSIHAKNIIADANDRLTEWNEIRKDKDSHFIPSGFKELDDVTGGWHCGEELIVLFARTGQGKSWVLIKMLEHAWKMNRRVGLLEPEMSANKTGYRFDTVHKHVSNTSLLKGQYVQGYEKYIEKLSESSVPFYVAHPKDFNRKVTVDKLRTWVVTNNIDLLAIDGISYLTDARREKGDNRTTQLTNISEDLMDLSIELGIPIIVVAQSNRDGAKEEELSLENIRDSDGISYNASLVLAVQQKDPGIQIAIKKSRNSSASAKLSYIWDIDTGVFDYVPSANSGINDSERSSELRRRFDETDKDKPI